MAGCLGRSSIVMNCYACSQSSIDGQAIVWSLCIIRQGTEWPAFSHSHLKPITHLSTDLSTLDAESVIEPLSSTYTFPQFLDPSFNPWMPSLSIGACLFFACSIDHTQEKLPRPESKYPSRRGESCDLIQRSFSRKKVR